MLPEEIGKVIFINNMAYQKNTMPSKSEANTVTLKHQINSCLTEVVISFKRYFLRLDHYIFLIGPQRRDWKFLSYRDTPRME